MVKILSFQSRGPGLTPGQPKEKGAGEDKMVR